jgi:RNA 3'-terminal phosphate cyclase (ATP)
MHSIDGRGGGGQLVRTAVALSAVTGYPIRMADVRGAREQPGLKPQHVAAIETVAALTDATMEDVTVGSESFEFEPDAVPSGSHEQVIGTAGSLTLVFDAVLPLAVRIENPTKTTISGGTDVKWSPPFDYFRHVKLPLVRSTGLQATTSLDRRGFYPSGGGRAELTIEPSTIESIDLETRGPLQSVTIHSIASTSLESASVAERQADAATEVLESAGEPVSDPSATIDRRERYVETPDKGSVITIVAQFESSVAGFTALGEPGKPAEDVATTATDRFETFVDTNAAVDSHMADQLVPFLALAGGRVRIPRVTDHVETHLDLVREFECSVTLEDLGNGEARLVAPS